MNGLPQRSLGPHGWQLAGDSSPQLEQFICCNYWQDNAVGASGGRLGMGPGPGSAQSYIHTLRDTPHRRSSVSPRPHTQEYPFPHPRGYTHLSKITSIQLELKPEPSDGIHVPNVAKSSKRNRRALRDGPKPQVCRINRVLHINKAQREPTELQGVPGTRW